MRRCEVDYIGCQEKATDYDRLTANIFFWSLDDDMEYSHTTSKPEIHSKETSVVIEVTNTTASNPDEEIHAPFNDLGTAAMEQKIRTFLEETRLYCSQEDLRKGAYLAQDSTAFDRGRLDGLALSDEEEAAMIEERSARRKPWKQPRTLKILVFFCALGAAVQGWDEAAVNGGKLVLLDTYTRSDFD